MTYQRNMGSSSGRGLDDGLDAGLPDRVHQAEVAPGQDDEARHHRGRPACRPAVRSVAAAQLVHAVAEEGEPAATAARVAGLRLLLGDRRVDDGGRNEVALDLVRSALEVV